jgi:hypothetical protein
MMTGKPDDSAPGENPGFKPRRTTRVDVSDVRTSLSPQDLYNVEVRVRNVSTAGFMAECAAAMRIGSYLSLDIPGIGPVQAQVRWQIGQQMGGMFLDPISLARCEWTAERAKAAAV